MVSVDAELGDASPQQPPSRAVGRIIAVAAVTIAIDQATKEWALRVLSERPGQRIELFWTLQWNLVRNYGASFSSFEGGGPIISVIAVAVAIALVVFGRKQDRLLIQVLYGLIVGGALGNVIDRLLRTRADEGFLGGGVVDFIDVQFWPVWNIADMAVVCSAIVLVVESFLDERRTAAAAADVERDGVS